MCRTSTTAGRRKRPACVAARAGGPGFRLMRGSGVGVHASLVRLMIERDDSPPPRVSSSKVFEVPCRTDTPRPAQRGRARAQRRGHDEPQRVHDDDGQLDLIDSSQPYFLPPLPAPLKSRDCRGQGHEKEIEQVGRSFRRSFMRLAGFFAPARLLRLDLLLPALPGARRGISLRGLAVELANVSVPLSVRILDLRHGVKVGARRRWPSNTFAASPRRSTGARPGARTRPVDSRSHPLRGRGPCPSETRARGRAGFVAISSGLGFGLNP